MTFQWQHAAYLRKSDTIKTQSHLWMYPSHAQADILKIESGSLAGTLPNRACNVNSAVGSFLPRFRSCRYSALLNPSYLSGELVNVGLTVTRVIPTQSEASQNMQYVACQPALPLQPFSVGSEKTMTFSALSDRRVVARCLRDFSSIL